MTLKQILDYALPMPADAYKCKPKMQKWKLKREKLSAMIEQYKNGQIVDTSSPLTLKVNWDEITKMITPDN